MAAAWLPAAGDLPLPGSGRLGPVHAKGSALVWKEEPSAPSLVVGVRVLWRQLRCGLGCRGGGPGGGRRGARARGSGVGWLPWPCGRHGGRFAAFDGDGAACVIATGCTMFWRRRVLAGVKVLSGFSQTDGGGIYWRRILLEGVVAVALCSSWCFGGNPDPLIGRWRRSGAVPFLKASPWSPWFVVRSYVSSR